MPESAVPLIDSLPSLASVRLERTTGASKTSTEQSKVEGYKAVEALLMRTMVETMLPSDAKSVFGSGVAGSTWKGFLAESIANELAKDGRLGIAKELAKAR